MCLCGEVQRGSRQKLQDVLTICVSLSDSQTLKSNVIEKLIQPGALRFDHIAAQAGQSSTGISENGCHFRSKRRKEAESFSKPVKVTKCCVAVPGSTIRHTTSNTTEMLARAAFWSFEAFKH